MKTNLDVLLNRDYTFAVYYTRYKTLYNNKNDCLDRYCVGQRKRVLLQYYENRIRILLLLFCNVSRARYRRRRSLALWTLRSLLDISISFSQSSYDRSLSRPFSSAPFSAPGTRLILIGRGSRSVRVYGLVFY